MISVPVKIVKLLSADLTNKIEEEAALAGGGKAEDDESDLDDDDEDDGEFDEDYGDEEDEDHGSKSKKDKYGYLSDLLDAHGLDMDGEGYDDDEEDEMDPDILADPIYQMSLKVKGGDPNYPPTKMSGTWSCPANFSLPLFYFLGRPI